MKEIKLYLFIYKMNEIEWNILFNIVCFHGILFTTVRFCTNLQSIAIFRVSSDSTKVPVIYLFKICSNFVQNSFKICSKIVQYRSQSTQVFLSDIKTLHSNQIFELTKVQIFKTFSDRDGLIFRKRSLLCLVTISVVFFLKKRCE